MSYLYHFEKMYIEEAEKRAHLEAVLLSEEKRQSQGLEETEPATSYNAAVHFKSTAPPAPPEEYADLSGPIPPLSAFSESDEESQDCQEQTCTQSPTEPHSASHSADEHVTPTDDASKGTKEASPGGLASAANLEQQKNPSKYHPLDGEPGTLETSPKTDDSDVAPNLPPDAKVSVAAKISVGRLHDQRTRIDLTYSLTQNTEGSGPKHDYFIVHYHAGNIKGPVQFRSIDTLDQLDDDVRESVHKGIHLNNIVELKLESIGGKRATNLFGDTDFGVFNEFVGKIRSCVSMAHEVVVVLQDAASALSMAERFNRELAHDCEVDEARQYQLAREEDERECKLQGMGHCG